MFQDSRQEEQVFLQSIRWVDDVLEMEVNTVFAMRRMSGILHKAGPSASYDFLTRLLEHGGLDDRMQFDWFIRPNSVFSPIRELNLDCVQP